MKEVFFKSNKLVLAVIALLLLSCFCGCGANDDETDIGENIDSEINPNDPFYSFNDGIIEHILAASIDTYIEMGFSQKEAEKFFYIDEMRKNYVDYDYFVIDFKDSDSIISKDVSGNELKSFVAKGPNGTEVKFEAKNIRLTDSGELIFTNGSEIISLTAVDGLAYVAPNVIETSGSDYEFMCIKTAVNLAGLDEVSSPDELLFQDECLYGVYQGYDLMECYSGFGFFKLRIENDGGEIRISDIAIRYSGVKQNVVDVSLDTDFYGYYAEGGYYDFGKEKFILDEGIFDFYLVFKTDAEIGKFDPDAISIYGTEDYEIKDLYDSSGNVKGKDEPLSIGDYLVVDVKGYPCKVKLPVYGMFNPRNLCESMPANTVTPDGALNVLVVPYYFADQDFTQEERHQLLSYLGRVADFNGNTLDYSPTGEYFTFSDYYEKASYGKLKITSYVTDSFKFEDKTFADFRDSMLESYEIAGIQDWINEKYADHIGDFDQNGDGIFDAVILVCDEGEDLGYYTTISNSGAVSLVDDYTYDYALTDGKAALTHYVVINSSMFMQEGNQSANVLIHEFGHQLGLIDYYDVTYSGINAVGGFDMQSDNYGDWNPFSKFAVGWTTPIVLDEAKIGDGITVTIDEFAKTGDTIIIPTRDAVYNLDGSLNPFNEYIMIDLFSPEGVNKFDAEKYGLNQKGVRIYHVDSKMIGIPIDTADGSGMTVGDFIHNNSYSESGMYCIETIQKGGENTFTETAFGTTTFCGSDLFYKGNAFSMSSHSAFFTDGLMDDRTEFPYTITVESIDGDTATIRISK